VTGNLTKHIKSCSENPINKKLCPVCNNTFSSKSTTCSYACSNKHFRSGENNGNWKEDAYRSTCFEYHRKECIICKEENLVEVHHLDENHMNNSPENLIPLCPTHHQYWHSKYKHIVEKQVIDYISEWKSGHGTRNRT
jgi:HNH endonuclease